ncbi:MAG: hypothetical protein WD226_01995, partial [Planctomycetota bacterium]
ADSPQGDVRMVEHLAAFGVDAHGSATELGARGLPSRGAVLDLAGEPDLAPLLAVVALRAALDHGSTSELHGLGTLRGKESDRLAALAELVAELGFEGRVVDDALFVGPGTPRRPSAPLDPAGDHRIAFAQALLGTFLDGIDVLAPECVSKSWPEFWSALSALAPRRGLH